MEKLHFYHTTLPTITQQQAKRIPVAHCFSIFTAKRYRFYCQTAPKLPPKTGCKMSKYAVKTETGSDLLI